MNNLTSFIFATVKTVNGMIWKSIMLDMLEICKDKASIEKIDFAVAGHLDSCSYKNRIRWVSVLLSTDSIQRF